MDATAAGRVAHHSERNSVSVVGPKELSNKKTPQAADAARHRKKPRATAEANTAKKRHDPPRANEGRHLAY